MQRYHFYKGRRVRNGNRVGGRRKKEILDSSSFPRHVGREMTDGELMQIELVEQITDWRDDCTNPVPPQPMNGALRTVLVWIEPGQNGTVQVSRNGSHPEPIVPKACYFRHPHTPSWFSRPMR